MTEAASNEGQRPKAERTPAETRVDPAHRLGSAPETAGSQQKASSPALAALAQETSGPGDSFSLTAEQTAQITWSESGVALVSQVREQATQLARHLQTQQQHLDRREAELHSREAALENEVRSARMWLTARQAELEEQAAELLRQAEQIVEAEAEETDELETPARLRLHTGEEDAAVSMTTQKMRKDLELRNRALDVRQKDLDRREEKLARHEQEQETLAEDLQRREILLAQLQGKIDSQRQDLEQRHRQMDERQALLYRDIEHHTQERARMVGDQHALEELRADIAISRAEYEQQRLLIEAQRADCQNLRTETAALLEFQQSQHRDLEQREAALGERHKQIEIAILRFERLGVVEERMQQMDELAKQYQSRRNFLDEAETLLHQQEQELQTEREQLDLARAAHAESAERDHARWLEEQKRSAAELSRERESLQRRAEQLDLRDTALEQMRAEVNQSQREALETRLATEELWAQMAGPLAPASLARSLAQVRSKLAEHYRFTDRELAERRQEMEVLRRTLEEKHLQLQQQRHELEDWAESQREMIEEHAARLVAREQELDRQQVYFENLELRWQEERHGFRRDIRHLLAKLRSFTPEAGQFAQGDFLEHAAVA